MTNAKKAFIVFSGLLTFLTSVLFFGFFNGVPDQVAIHWNLAGQVDGYSSKLLGLGLFPILMIVFGGLFLILPKLDPLNKNFVDFQKEYFLLSGAIMLVFYSIFTFVLFWNLGFLFDMTQVFSIIFGVLWFVIAYVLKGIKRNFFVGIRTPWTISSDIVWSKTHILGSKLFFISGLLSLIGGFSSLAFWFVIGPVLISSLISIIYSYIIFQGVSDQDSKYTKI